MTGCGCSYLPAFWRYIGPYLPPRNAYILLRNSIYFDGHGTTQALIVLLLYLAIPAVALVLLYRFRTPKPHHSGGRGRSNRGDRPGRGPTVEADDRSRSKQIHARIPPCSHPVRGGILGAERPFVGGAQLPASACPSRRKAPALFESSA